MRASNGTKSGLGLFRTICVDSGSSEHLSATCEGSLQQRQSVVRIRANYDFNSIARIRGGPEGEIHPVVSAEGKDTAEPDRDVDQKLGEHKQSAEHDPNGIGLTADHFLPVRKLDPPRCPQYAL